MTNAVQSMVDLRNEMSEKINRLIPVSYFDNQFGDLLGRFTSDIETVSNAFNNHAYRLSMQSLPSFCYGNGPPI